MKDKILLIVAFIMGFLASRIFDAWYTSLVLIAIYIIISILIYIYKKSK